MKHDDRIDLERLDPSISTSNDHNKESLLESLEYPNSSESSTSDGNGYTSLKWLKNRIKESAISYRLRNRNFYLMVLFDSVLFAIAHLSAYLIRFEFQLETLRTEQILFLLPYLIPLKIIVFYASGLYRGMYRYTSLVDSWKLVRATFLSTLLLIVSILYFNRFENFSRAVFIIDGFLTFILTGGFRISIRIYYNHQTGLDFPDYLFPSKKDTFKEGWKRTVIIGAGNAGEQILREIFNNPRQVVHVIGFVDDDQTKKGSLLHGIPVLGNIIFLPKIISKHKIEQVLIAIPSGRGEQIRKIVGICEEFDVECKTLPTLTEIINGRVTVSDFRPVNYQDLLGRATVKLDMVGISDYLSGKVVLVTGCGGSIGSELCRQIIRFTPQKLILIDAAEENLFNIQTELLHERKFMNYQSILGRVQNEDLMNRVFHKFQPEVVFHAAAYKHVPMMELNPWEAFFNNIMASWSAMKVSERFKVARFVLVSTDKAVRPTNVMGASKRVAELLLQTYQGNYTRYMAVRFGNVLGSSGSVVPLFEKQIKNGGPVTVTHPEVTRYFMTIPESVQLILQAGSMGKGGEIFILKMGIPVKIVDMARDLIRLSGKEPDKDIKIIFTGLRPGEKLFEELITEGEDIEETRHEDIMVLNSNGEKSDYKNNIGLKNCLYKQLTELMDLGLKMDAEGIKQKLHEIVCEYTPQTKINAVLE